MYMNMLYHLLLSTADISYTRIRLKCWEKLTCNRNAYESKLKLTKKSNNYMKAVTGQNQ